MPIQATPYPMGVGGAVAMALANANAQGDFQNIGEGLGGAINYIRQQRLLDTPLSQLGISEQQALLAGAGTPPGTTFTSGPDGNGQGLTGPQPLPANMMTMRDIMKRHTALGPNADTALQPSLAALMGTQAQALPSSEQPFAALPYGIAEKMAPYLRPAVRPQVYVGENFADQLKKFQQSGNPQDQPVGLPSPTAEAMVPMDQKVFQSMLMQNAQMAKKFNSSALTPEQNGAIDKALNDGRLAREGLNMRPQALVALANQFIKNPAYNASASDVSLAGSKKFATSEAGVRGGEGTRTAAAAGSVEDLLGELGKLWPTLSANSVRVLNSAYLGGLRQVDDKDANKALALLNDVAYLQAKVNKGGLAAPTEEDVKIMRENFAKGLGSAGLAGVTEASKIANASRVSRLQTGKAPAASTPAPAVNPIYSSPQGQAILAAYRAKKLTKDQANAQLNALGGGGGGPQ